MIDSRFGCSLQVFVSELKKQYEFLEKLHSLVIAEKFVIIKEETDIFFEILDIKTKMLQKLEAEGQNLGLLQAKLKDCEEHISPDLIQKALSKFKKLLMEIIRLQKANARFFSELKKNNN